MTEALRRVPRALRVGSVLALAMGLVVMGAVVWTNERTASQENFRLYDQCLSTADDVSQVRACTREFYVRRDGKPGGSDPVQLAIESSRLEELRAAGVVDAAAPVLDPQRDPTGDPTDPRPGPTAPPVAAVPPATTEAPVVTEQEQPEASTGDGSGQEASPTPEPTTTKNDSAATAGDQSATSQRPDTSPAQKPTTEPTVPVMEPRPSRPTGGPKDRSPSPTSAG